MMENFPSVRNESGEVPDYQEQLAETLGISEQQKEGLISMFHSYCETEHLENTNETLVVRNIRHFLHDQKSEIYGHFADSLLGQSGCFPFSVKCSLLAKEFGIDTRLARARNLNKLLHVLVLRPDGRPFDLTDPTLKIYKTTPLSIPQAYAYARVAQPIATAGGRLKRTLGAHRAHKSSREEVAE